MAVEEQRRFAGQNADAFQRGGGGDAGQDGQPDNARLGKCQGVGFPAGGGHHGGGRQNHGQGGEGVVEAVHEWLSIVE